MPNWLWVVLAVVGVLVVGLVRERKRMRGLEGWAKSRGLQLHSPFIPGDSPPMAALAERLGGRPARRWGAGLTGRVDGLDVVIAEHETTPSGGDASGSMNTIGIWRVAIAWPVRASSSTPVEPPDPWPHGGELAQEGGWAAWRLRGNLTQATVESLLAYLPEARRRFE